MGFVRVSIDSRGIATLVLNDAERRNAMGLEMAEEFEQAISDLTSEGSLRSVIITGAGSAFAAGGDLQMLKEKSKLHRHINREQMLKFYEQFLCIQRLSVPVIAAINGHAIGAGMCLAMGCDYRVVSETAKLGFTFTKLALHPGMGATLFVSRVAGAGVAADLLLSGRIFTADEARMLGLVSRVVPADGVLASARSWAESLLVTGPQAIADLLVSIRPAPEELRASLEREAGEQAKGYARDEFLEGVNATIEKRPPNF